MVCKPKDAVSKGSQIVVCQRDVMQERKKTIEGGFLINISRQGCQAAITSRDPCSEAKGNNTSHQPSRRSEVWVRSASVKFVYHCVSQHNGVDGSAVVEKAREY